MAQQLNQLIQPEMMEFCSHCPHGHLTMSLILAPGSSDTMGTFNHVHILTHILKINLKKRGNAFLKDKSKAVKRLEILFGQRTAVYNE